MFAAAAEAIASTGAFVAAHVRTLAGLLAALSAQYHVLSRRVQYEYLCLAM